jgi:hypothetical protein
MTDINDQDIADDETIHHCNLKLDPIQHELPSCLIGWFLYSFPEISSTALELELSRQTGINIAIRLQNVSLGSSLPDDYREVPALHIWVPKKDVTNARQKIRDLYKLETQVFPLGIRLRFIPPAADFSYSGQQLFVKTRHRQDVLLHTIVTIECGDIVDIDARKNGYSLRELIMRIQATNTSHSLFLSVDPVINQPTTTVFVCLPRFETEARSIVSNLRYHLQPPPGFSVNYWFTDAAIGMDIGITVQKNSPSPKFQLSIYIIQEQKQH